ncbi:MAG: YciI family protein [Acidobacteriota bacterium]
MKVLFANIILALVLVSAVSAQTAVAESKKPVPQYDAELAKRLGADERGMRNYVLAILRTGPANITDKDVRAKLFQGHFAMINRLAGEGKLSVAGPLDDPKGEYRGIYVFNVATVEEAQKLTETDPSIKAGIFRVEFIKWYASAGLMEVTNIHGRVQPPKP